MQNMTPLLTGVRPSFTNLISWEGSFMQLAAKEIVKEINGFEGFYSVTSHGRVWSHRRKKWLKPCIAGRGYQFVTLSINGDDVDKKMHRLVAEAFIANPDNKPQVNHKNGIKSDCRVSNLEWVTAKENLQHACDNGLNKHFKLNNRDRDIIYWLFTTLKVAKNKIAKMFNMSPSGVAYVIKTYVPSAA